jgi:hypothetical protein
MQSQLAFIRGVAHPEAFHGTGKTGGFFEGWYVKLVSADLKQRWAVIPGIFRGLESTEDTAFVQVALGFTLFRFLNSKPPPIALRFGLPIIASMPPAFT